MEVRDYVTILWRRKWIILVTIVVTLAVVTIGTRLTIPVYQATSVIRIAVSSGGALNYQEYIYSDQLMSTYVEMATRRPVVEELMKRITFDKPPEIRAEIIPNTELISLTVEDINPNRAAEAANTLAEILIAQGNQLYVGGGKSLSDVLGEQLAQLQPDVEAARQKYEVLTLQTPPSPDEIDTAKQLLELKQNNYETLLAQYQQAQFREELQGSMITIFETATVPDSPSRPRLMLDLVLGLVVGVMGGLGLTFIFENLDTTLYTTEQIENVTKLSAFAKIPKVKKHRTLASLDIFSPLSEAFRNLATNIQYNTQRKTLKVLLVMSAEPHQGKSLIVSQLALALAEFGKNIVVVDCDMRRPRLHNYFEVSNQYGLTDVLERRMGLDTALQKSPYPGVCVLASGSLPSHTSKLLSSPQMSELINSLRIKFDYVLLDTPALLGIADVAALIRKVGSILWIVRRTYAKLQAVEDARQFLKSLDDKSISLIINQVDNNGSYSNYYKPQRKNLPTTSHDQEIDTHSNEVVGIGN